MKKLKTTLVAALLIAGAATAYGKIITVSNHPNSPGQYTELQAACDAAEAGDTIYVSGSPDSYGAITLTKKLTLIGAGYRPNNQFQHASEIGSIDLSVGVSTVPGDPIATPAGSTIIGFNVGHVTSSPGSYASIADFNDITIERNKISYISSSGRCNKWIIRNNIIDYLVGQLNESSNAYSINFIITNNIFIYGINLFSSNTVLISNNLFFKDFSFSNLRYAVITNNIFYGIQNLGNKDKLSNFSYNYCTFNNNISLGAEYDFFNNANNTGGGNMHNINPQFTAVKTAAFEFDNDYRLKATSPGKNAGTDGTDIGIHGGAYSFPAAGEVPWLYTAMPAMPHVIKMDIQNSVLPVDGKLKVKTKAVSQK